MRRVHPTGDEVASVGIRKLKAGLSQFVQRAGRGDVVLVTDRGRPIAMLAPLPPGLRVVDDLRRAGWLDWAGGKPSAAPVAVAHSTPDVAGAVVEGRSR